MPLAAEGSSPEAQEHRALSMEFLEQRSLLPSMLAAALSTKHGPAADILQGTYWI